MKTDNHKLNHLWQTAIAFLAFVLPIGNLLAADSLAQHKTLATTGLQQYFPDFAFNKFIGLYIWQIFELILLHVFIIVTYRTLSWIFGYFLVKIFRKFKRSEIANKYIKPISKPLSLLLIVSTIRLIIPGMELPGGLRTVIYTIIKIMAPVYATVVAYRVSDMIADIFAAIASRTKTKIDDNFVPLVRKAMKLVVVILGCIYILENIGVPITPLLAGVSIGGLAFALAAQDTLKNLFGSVTIFTDQPFDVGDWIVFDGVEGTVEEVGVRSTRVRTFYDSIISIPNGRLADIKIDNMGRREFRRYKTNIGITYDTPPEVVDAFVEGLKRIIEIHPNTRKDYYQIHLNGFGASSLDILFYVFFKVPDWTAELKTRHEVILEIIRLAKELGVRFAYPTETLFVEEMPGQPSLTPKFTGDAKSLKSVMNTFIEKRKMKYSEG